MSWDGVGTSEFPDIPDFDGVVGGTGGDLVAGKGREGKTRRVESVNELGRWSSVAAKAGVRGRGREENRERKLTHSDSSP